MTPHRPRVVIDARWIERAGAAFSAAVAQNGAPTKVMACWLQEHGFWDASLPVDSVVAKFNNCLRGAKGERFRAIEILALTAQFGGVDLLEFYASSMGYELRRIPDAEFDAQLVETFDQRLRAVEAGIADLANIRALIEARATAERTTPQRVLFSRADECPL